MNNLLKFLLTFALLLCAIFSVMLIVGCEETNNIKCAEDEVYDNVINKCTIPMCNDFFDCQVGVDKPCGCLNNHYLICDEKCEIQQVVIRISFNQY